MKKYQIFLSEKFMFLEVKFSIYLNRRVLVMHTIYWTEESIFDFRYARLYNVDIPEEKW